MQPVTRLSFAVRFAFPSVLAALAALAPAQSPVNPGLGGTTEFSGWENFNPGTYPGTGNFPGSSAWATPLAPNVSGSGDANLMKAANGASGGGPYVSSTSIYFGSFVTPQNGFGGTLRVADATPVAALKTVTFQLLAGEAFGYDLYNRADPVLSYTYVPTGSTTPVSASFGSTLFSTRMAHVDTGNTFTDPTTGQPQELYNNLYGYQWDLSTIGGAVTGLSVTFNGVQHSQVYALRLDQGSQTTSPNVFAAVPEPASLAALAIGAAALLRRRRKA